MSAWWPAGAHLEETLGPRYAVIDSAVGVSDENGIGRPEDGSIGWLGGFATGSLVDN
ncbi:hypothetical protein [Sorangium sp. So ce887]|uniref:hypothetical protein n=1 Tax=Sorangium sp. So ce887 TaxID=3133324 RepID=UPI003F6464D4